MNDDGGNNGDVSLRIVENEDAPSVLDGVGFGKLGLVMPDDWEYAQWEAFGERLQAIDRAAPWWIGDWLNYGERKFGEMYSQALDVTSKAYQTLANRKYVAGVFPLSKRRAKLSFSHHAAVASLVRVDPTSVTMILDEAEAMGQSEKEVRVIARKLKLELGLDPTGDDGYGSEQLYSSPVLSPHYSDDTLIQNEGANHMEWLDDLLSIVKKLSAANNGIELMEAQDMANDWLSQHNTD
jgi:hypothetical protein